MWHFTTRVPDKTITSLRDPSFYVDGNATAQAFKGFPPSAAPLRFVPAADYFAGTLTLLSRTPVERIQGIFSMYGFHLSIGAPTLRVLLNTTNHLTAERAAEKSGHQVKGLIRLSRVRFHRLVPPDWSKLFECWQRMINERYNWSALNVCTNRPTQWVHSSRRSSNYISLLLY